MKEIIQQKCLEFIHQVLSEVTKEDLLQLDELETRIKRHSDSFVIDVLSQYIECVDEQIREDKPERKKQGLSVQRKEDKREIVTTFGSLGYMRTYYKDAKNQKYAYPADQVAGLEGYERVSLNGSAALINRAAEVSYQKSSKHITGGHVTRQTVKNKLRKVNRFEEAPLRETKQIKTLYLVADEDHVALQNGRNTMVPLIVVYEGKEKVSKGRYRCMNARYFGRYGIKTEDLWYEVLDWIDKTYCYEKIEQIYIHGDGASWIKKGLEIIMKSKFVLDKYHIQKVVLRATGNQPEFREDIQQAIRTADKDMFMGNIQNLLLNATDEKEAKRIHELNRYILNNWSGIEIKVREDCGGCCAEGQVSHTLSERLSSRPMGWSPEGLKKMVDVRIHIANKNRVEAKDLRKQVKQETYVVHAIQRAKSKISRINPDCIGNIALIQTGKVTPLYKWFKNIQKAEPHTS